LSNKRARRVIRLHQLHEFLGIRRTAVDRMVKAGLLHPVSLTGQRSRVVFEDEVRALQDAAVEKAKREAAAESEAE